MSATTPKVEEEDTVYDLVVIGGGSGGSALSKRAAGYGAKVAIVDRGTYYAPDGSRVGAGQGGTCVNVGCVPKKLMFMAAGVKEALGDEVGVAKGFGFDVKDVSFDWAGLKARRDAYVRRLSKGYISGWEKAGVEVIEGTATFATEFQKASSKDFYRVEVTDARNDDGAKTKPFRVLKASRVAIACGGKVTMPAIPGVEHAISSDGFFDLPTQPKKCAVVGAGYIAVEMAGILHALGTETHLFFRGDTVLRRGFDPFIVERLMESLEAHGPALHAQATPAAIELADDGTKTLILRDGSKHTGFDVILAAIGREPLARSLRLPAGLEVDKDGYVVVDAYENTSLKRVYALGDATTTGYELTPVAIAAGRRLADRLFGGEPRARLEYYDIATVVFSHPPIGTVGLTEPEAVARFGKDNVKVKQSAFGSMLFAFNEAEHKVKTGLKLVLAGPEETVVGLHCIGPMSDEMLQGFAVAVRMGATRRDFEASVAIHPTIAEEFVTFGGWGQKKVGDTVKVWLPPYLDDPKPTFASSATSWLFNKYPQGNTVASFLLGLAAAGAAFALLQKKA